MTTATESPRAEARLLRHELRTPVNHIFGFGELLAEEAEDAGLADLAAGFRAVVEQGRHVLQGLNAEPFEPEGLFDRVGTHLDAVVAACGPLREGLAGSPLADLAGDLDKIRRAASVLRDRLAALAGRGPSA